MPRCLLPLLLLGSVACQTDTDVDGTPDWRDCAPEDPSIHADAEEVCDGIDNNCSGQIDEDVTLLAYWDRDGDGYGDTANARRVCTMPEDGSEMGGDCDDQDANIYPDAAELCDGRDNDCDEAVDEGALLTFYEDEDGDGHGAPGASIEACLPPDGYASVDDDCDDSDPLAWTDAPELCDAHDNDCDGEVDEGLALVRTWRDGDGDGSGSALEPTLACGDKPGFSLNDADCDDADDQVGPHANDEPGNGFDEDCDGYVDEYGVPYPYATLADALDAAPDGSVVQLDAGLHRGVVDLRGRSLTLAGEGCDATTLLANAAASVITTDGGVTIERLTVSGGTGTLNPEFLGGRTEGGGLLVTDGLVNVRQACFSGNEVTKYGGAISVKSGGALVLDDVTLADNIADHQGGGLYVWPSASADIVRTRFLGNTATKFDGGGLSVHGGTVDVSNTMFGGNVAGDDGGAAHVQNFEETTFTVAGQATFVASTFHANRGGDGDVLHQGSALHAQDNADVVVRDTVFSQHPQTLSIMDDETGASFDVENCGFGDAGGSDTREGHIMEATRGRALYIMDDPSMPASQWDLRPRPGTPFEEIGAHSGDDASPDALEGFLDTDGDGLSDGWEIRYGTNRWVDDASADPDRDGLTNLVERDLDTSPNVADTDADGLDDGEESANGSDPTLWSDNRPIADAGHDRFVMAGHPVTLDGRQSWDPSDLPMTPTWSVLAPALSSVTQTEADDAWLSSFVPDVAGVYEVTLTVANVHAAQQVVVRFEAVRGWTVPDDVPTIQGAVDLAGDGDGIGIRPGTYNESVVVEGKELTLVGLGDGPTDVLIDPYGLGAGIDFTRGGSDNRARLTLAMLSIVGGQHPLGGGGVHANDIDRLVLQDVVLSENVGLVSGGSVYVDADAATFERVHFGHSWAPNGGGLYALDTRTTLSDCVFDDNTAEFGGAVATQAGTTLLRRISFHENTATTGACAHTVGGSIRLENSVSIGSKGTSAFANLLGTVDLVNSAFLYPEVTHLFDGDSGWSALYSFLVGVDDSQTDTEAFATLADALEVADSLFLRVSADGARDNELLAPYVSSLAQDGGLVTRHDVDGTPSDIGLTGGSPLGRDCRIRDGDLDGLDDIWEIDAGTDPTRADTGDDTDSDGLNASAEYIAGTDPNNPDSDYDGLSDSVDMAPLNPAGQRVAVSPAILTATGQPVVGLSANATSPIDGELTVSWRVANVPQGSAVGTPDLVGIDLQEVEFTADVEGAYTLEVIADDGSSDETALITIVYDE